MLSKLSKKEIAPVDLSNKLNKSTGASTSRCHPAFFYQTISPVDRNLFVGVVVNGEFHASAFTGAPGTVLLSYTQGFFPPARLCQQCLSL